MHQRHQIFEGYAGAYVPAGGSSVKVTSGSSIDTFNVTLVPDRRIPGSHDQWLELEFTIVAVTDMMNEIIGNLEAALGKGE